MAVLGILLLSGDTKEDLVELPEEEEEGIVTTWQPVQNGGANELLTSNDDFCGQSSYGLGQEEVDGPPAPSLIWDGQEWLRNVEIKQARFISPPHTPPLPKKRFKKWKNIKAMLGIQIFS